MSGQKEKNRVILEDTKRQRREQFRKWRKEVVKRGRSKLIPNAKSGDKSNYTKEKKQDSTQTERGQDQEEVSVPSSCLPLFQVGLWVINQTIIEKSGRISHLKHTYTNLQITRTLVSSWEYSACSIMPVMR